MKHVYKQTEAGWVHVKECQSFRHACAEAERLWSESGVEHCVNTGPFLG
jgi:hypothetical protein